MAKKIVGSILHGAYGDLFHQAICLKHYALTHPEIDLKLFASRSSRLESFSALDFSFASSFELWTEIENHPEIDQFFQFQVFDFELKRDVFSNLSETTMAKFDREHNKLPFQYLRDNHLIPTPKAYQLPLSESGKLDLVKISEANEIPEGIWAKPTVSFLWRYRMPGLGTISNIGQKTQEAMVESYSAMFTRLIKEFDCHVLICGMNLKTDDTNRERTDNKYPSFGLNLPADRVTYLKGLSWPLELEISARATVSCGNASGFTEGIWLNRGRDMVIMDVPPHYLAKIVYHRVPFFGLNDPLELWRAMFSRSGKAYGRRIGKMLKRAQTGVL